ncbi:MAG: hypothetical protein JEZ05_01600 [Tenericutes bacterium]|nr:hypothetical protein [Mycoplasmatota bacterium]
MEQKQKVEKKIKNTEVNRILIETRDYHDKQNNLLRNISKFIMGFVGALLAFFIVQGLSPDVSVDARNAYTVFGILLILPFILLLLVLFDVGKPRLRSRRINLFDLHSSRIISRLTESDFLTNVVSFLNSEKLSTENRILCNQIVLISNKIKVKRLLIWIIPIIPIIELIFVVISMYSIYYQ